MAVFDADESGLSPAQLKAIGRLAAGGTVTEAAKAAGVGRTTVYSWMRQPEFAAELRYREGLLLDWATRKLLNLQDAALGTFEAVLSDPEASHATRLRAAMAVLDHLLKLRELRDLEGRLQALEEAVINA